MNFVNLTPHVITIHCQYGEADLVIQPEPEPARVTSAPGSCLSGGPVPLYSAPNFGAVQGLPDPIPGVSYIVSGLVAGRCVGRSDVWSPGTGPNDSPIRKEGRIVAVTRLIQAPQQ